MQPTASDGVIVRAVTRADLPALKTVVDSTGLFPAEMLDGMTDPYLSGADSADRWLTLDDGEPVGVAYVAPERMTSGTWNLYLIAVRADRQGRGYGARLLGRVERELAGRGERVLLVETSGWPSFERVRLFYERCGYEQEARIRDFYQAGEDKIVFRKALVSAPAAG
jgi:GNAT superfamily N-acetyltransferase